MLRNPLFLQPYLVPVELKLLDQCGSSDGTFEVSYNHSRFTLVTSTFTGRNCVAVFICSMNLLEISGYLIQN
jgi:hypothetical protein